MKNHERHTDLEIPFAGLVAEDEHAKVDTHCACGRGHEEDYPFGDTVSLSVSPLFGDMFVVGHDRKSDKVDEGEAAYENLFKGHVNTVTHRKVVFINNAYKIPGDQVVLTYYNVKCIVFASISTNLEVSKMQLTTENLAQFAGGQLEVQNPSENYLYRGEIESVVVEDGDVKVRFVWCAKGKEGGWINDDNLDYGASTMIYRAQEIGNGRLAMSSFITGETAVFFPPDGSKLDPAKVEGLVLAS